MRVRAAAPQTQPIRERGPAVQHAAGAGERKGTVVNKSEEAICHAVLELGIESVATLVGTSRRQERFAMSVREDAFVFINRAVDQLIQEGAAADELILKARQLIENEKRAWFWLRYHDGTKETTGKRQEYWCNYLRSCDLPAAAASSAGKG